MDLSASRLPPAFPGRPIPIFSAWRFAMRGFFPGSLLPCLLVSALRVSLRLAPVVLGIAGLCHAQNEPVSGTPSQGVFRGHFVKYQQIGSKVLFEGDILLDRVQPLDPAHTRDVTFAAPESVGVIYPSYLWPQVAGVYSIPYTIVNGATNLQTAINQFNQTFTGFLQLVPQSTETDYVEINFDANDQSGQCESNVGHIGGVQQLGGSAACTVGTILHELGHTVGLFHEQSRADRGSYVTVGLYNVIKGSWQNFEQLQDNAQSIGSYDYASIMHYTPYAFSRNGAPVIESFPAGIPLSNDTGYTAGDIDGIERLYRAAPNAITITSNPVGLQVVVDGTRVTTPQVYQWGFATTHSLSVPAGAQNISGDTSGNAYIYGRWGHTQNVTSSIYIGGGLGYPTNPKTAPYITVYQANFIKLLPFSTAVYPTGAGSVTATPAPKTYSSVTGTYYVDRSYVSLSAKPASGQTFYGWWGYLPAGSGANPLAGRTPYGTVTAAFIPSTSPMTTVYSNPQDRWVYVDGTFFYTPKNFSPYYDSTWTPGSSHTVSTVTPQQPYSINTRYDFTSWSNGGAISQTIKAPAAGIAGLRANFTPSYVLANWINADCAGTVTLSPQPDDTGFYANNTQVQISQTPASGWTFNNWQYDVTGTANPATITVNDEKLVQANYNTSATPLTISRLMPTGVPAGYRAFTLFILGTGFTPASQVYIGGAYRASTYINPNELQVAITTADVAAPGGFQVGVGNFPSGASCYNFVPTSFSVLNTGAQIPSGISISASPNPVTAGNSVTITASVIPWNLPGISGTVNYYDNGTLIGSATANNYGIATFPTSALPSGTHTLTAGYLGNSTFHSNTSPPVTLVVQ